MPDGICVFTLVFALVMWINRAATLFDELVTDGHSAKVFLEFSVLGVTNGLSMVLPVSAFAATVYVTSRLSNELSRDPSYGDEPVAIGQTCVHVWFTDRHPDVWANRLSGSGNGHDHQGSGI